MGVVTSLVVTKTERGRGEDRELTSVLPSSQTPALPQHFLAEMSGLEHCPVSGCGGIFQFLLFVYLCFSVNNSRNETKIQL